MKFESLLVLASLVIATPISAAARPITTTRVIPCGAGNCLLVRGHRSSPLATVSINERPVEARGRTSWMVRLPVDTVRDWSLPAARMVRVTIADPAGAVEYGAAVPLPVGLLGGKMELASLVVRAR